MLPFFSETIRLIGGVPDKTAYKHLWFTWRLCAKQIRCILQLCQQVRAVNPQESPLGRWELCREWTLCPAHSCRAHHQVPGILAPPGFGRTENAPTNAKIASSHHNLKGNKNKAENSLEGWVYLSQRMGSLTSENHQHSYWVSLDTLSSQNKALFGANLTLLFWVHIVFIKIESSLC